MANFNAGAIEGTLTLDRSPFNRDLKEAMAEAKKFEQNKIKIPLEIDGMMAFAEIKAELNNLEDEVVTIELDVDGSGQISELEARLNAIRDETVTIEVEADAEGTIADLEAQLAAIPDEKVTIEVDADSAGAMGKVGAAFGGARALDATRFAIAGIAAILPTIVPLALGAAASIGAITSAMSILGVGLGAFALVAIPAWAKYKKAVKDAEGDMSKLSPQMRALKGEQDNLNKALAATPLVNRVYAVIGGGMRLIATAVVKLRPLIEVVTIAISNMITELIKWAESPMFTSMVQFLSANFIPIFQAVTGIFANLIKTIGGITVAFAPFAKSFFGGLNDITAAWANWAGSLSSSKKFQEFLDYVKATGPKIGALFMAIAAAIGNIGEALAPVAGPVLDGLIGLFEGIANINTSALGALLVGLSTGITLFIAIAAATAIWNLVMAANPISLIIIAVASLVAAFMYLWKTNEGFRNFFIGAWTAIWAVLQAIGGWFAGPFAGFFVAGYNAVKSGLTAVAGFFTTVWGGITSGLQAIGGFFSAVWNAIVTVLTTAWGIIKTIIIGGMAVILTIFNTIGEILLTPWRLFWGAFGGLITAAWNLVVAVIKFGVGVALAVIKAWLNITMQVVTTVWNGIKGFLTGSWNAIKAVATAVWNGIKGFMIGSWNALKSAASSIWKGIKSAVTSAVDAIKGPVSSAVNAVKTKVTDIWNNIKTTTSSIWNSLKEVVGKAIDGVKTKVGSVVDSIKGIFSGAGSWLINAGKNIIKGLIDGISSMIGAVTGKLKELTDKIPKVKGPERVDKALLRPAGTWIMEGFNSELEKGIDQALSTLSGFTGDIPDLATVNQQLSLAPNAATRIAQQPGITKEEFMQAMSLLIEEIRKNTQPLIGNYNDASKDPREIAEEWWFATKGR